MKILLTNDDGIGAKGLQVLYSELAKFADVLVVAPESEQSAVGHAITFLTPLRIKEFSLNGNFFGHAITGTPADSVKIGVQSIAKKPIDLVISGINLGANVSTNIIYSGTVSAATEGTLLGYPSIAVSLDTFVKPDFQPAARFTAKLAKYIYENGLPKGSYLNVNVPHLPEDKIKGVAVTKMGKSIYRDKFHKRKDPRGVTYYWQGGDMIYDEDEAEDADNRLLKKGMISVTPIHYDLTDYGFFEEMKGWKF
ncbi:MAG: 5'/3'-nucleotidase SurE [Nitrospinota bacterium]|nr:5'/3'-nucleotidase SurE [Nitrospinota bacterium]